MLQLQQQCTTSIYYNAYCNVCIVVKDVMCTTAAVEALYLHVINGHSTTSGRNRDAHLLKKHTIWPPKLHSCYTCVEPRSTD